MRRFHWLIFFLLAAAVIFSMGGCDSDDDEQGGPDSDRLMVITSPVLQVGQSYKIFRGDNVRIYGTNAKYYIAPIDNDEVPAVINLQFTDILSEDLPFVITAADEDAFVLLSYNPYGTVYSDYTTEAGGVIRLTGGTQQLMYSGLNVAGASLLEASAINIDTSNEITITLNDYSAQVNGGSYAPEYEYVWHADPQHRYEYYTEGDSEEELDESELEIEPLNGVYIAHDIRYVSNTINFEGIISVDDGQEYVAYYSETVQNQVARELGEGFEGPYIFATLPTINQTQSDEDEDDVEVSAALNNSDIPAFRKMTYSPEEAYENPVLHIVAAGTYRLRGTWLGQILVDPGENEDIAIILDGVTVSCDTGPAVVFRNVRECGPTELDEVGSLDIGSNILGEGSERAGAIVVIADGSINTISGTNTPRILKPEKKDDTITIIDGTDFSQQATLCKMDGVFYSSVSIAIGAARNTGNGRLNIISTTRGGLEAEEHMLLNSGTVTVTAEKDGINVNDNASVFTMNGGNMRITAKGGSGISSNGYIVLNNGTLDITAIRDSRQFNSIGNGPLHASIDVYVDTDRLTYVHQAYTEDTNPEDPNDNNNENPEENRTLNKQLVTVRDTFGSVILRIRYDTPEHDNATTGRTIPVESDVFTLQHRVNSFSGVKRK